MNTYFKTIAICATAILCCHLAHADVSTAYNVTVTRIYMYSEFGGGDVVFEVSSPPAGCYGFWLRPTDPGFKTLYAGVLTLYAAKTPAVVYAYNHDLWPGGTAFCRVYGLSPA